jgi:hypothetical protein
MRGREASYKHDVRAREGLVYALRAPPVKGGALSVLCGSRKGLWGGVGGAQLSLYWCIPGTVSVPPYWAACWTVTLVK